MSASSEHAPACMVLYGMGCLGILEMHDGKLLNAVHGTSTRQVWNRDSEHDMLSWVLRSQGHDGGQKAVKVPLPWQGSDEFSDSKILYNWKSKISAASSEKRVRTTTNRRFGFSSSSFQLLELT